MVVKIVFKVVSVALLESRLLPRFPIKYVLCPCSIVFRYTGQIYLELDNDQDLQDAQYLCQCYPELDYWKKCINDQDLRGFVTDESDDDNEKDDVENHNLSNLLEILEHSDTSEKGDVSDDDKDDQEWDEMCQILSQKSNNTGFDKFC